MTVQNWRGQNVSQTLAARLAFHNNEDRSTGRPLLLCVHEHDADDGGRARLEEIVEDARAEVQDRASTALNEIADAVAIDLVEQIGRASCRERV